MLFATGAIAELRRANDNPAFFTDEVAGEQHEWTDGLAERIVWPGTDAPSVCIFDTGVNRGHALIEPALRPPTTFTRSMRPGASTIMTPSGHGTGMADVISTRRSDGGTGDGSERRLTHRLELVKLLPPDRL